MPFVLGNQFKSLAYGGCCILQQAQDQYKPYVDKRHHIITFKEGENIYFNVPENPKTLKIVNIFVRLIWGGNIQVRLTFVL